MAETLKVLIVEDRPEDAALVLRMLRQDGHKVDHVCVDNSEALKSALRAKEWNLIIADYTLPDLRGLETLRIIQDIQGDDVPVIFVSGTVDDHTAVALMRAGAYDYVLKDNRMRLSEAVKRELAAAQTRRERKEAERKLDDERHLLAQVMSGCPDGICIEDRLGRVVRLNDAQCRIFGVATPEEVIGKTPDLFVSPRRAETWRQEDEGVFATGEPLVNHVEEVVEDDGAVKWLSVSKAPIRDQAGEIAGIVAITRDITERRLIERNAQLATIVATSGDAIVSLSDDGAILSWNPAAERVFGYAADEIVGRSERLLFAEDTEEEFEEYTCLRQSEHVVRNTLCRRKDGETIDVSISAAPMRQQGGRILGFSAILRDISEQRRIEKHMYVVMRELSHRTKNLLAVIVSMVRQTAESATDAVTMHAQLLERLQSLSASHDLLVAEDWTGAPLDELARAVMQPFVGSSSDAFDCSGPSVTVNAIAVQNLGLALHELATNAAKYGALSTPAGRVRLAWSLGPDSRGERRLIIDWSEHDGPAVSPPKVAGFGHVVIECVAAQALDADVTYAFPSDGVRWSISIPAEFIVEKCGSQSASAQAAA